MAIPADAIERYDRLIGTVDGVERRGASMPYTSRNGHMFSFLGPEGRLCLRLPEDERRRFVEEHDAGPCVQHGRELKEYVLVPDGLFERTDALAPAFRASVEYVGGLRPKPTTRRSRGG